MRVLNAGAHRAEQIEPLLDRQAVLVAVAIDRHAVHQLHHEERLPVRGGAAVHQPRDVGMVERRQRLAFELKAPEDLRRIGARPHDFERGVAAEGGVGALGAVDDAHAAAADDVENAPGADRRADQPRRRFGFGGQVRHLAGRGFEKARRTRCAT